MSAHRLNPRRLQLTIRGWLLLVAYIAGIISIARTLLHFFGPPQ